MPAFAVQPARSTQSAVPFSSFHFPFPALIVLHCPFESCWIARHHSGQVLHKLKLKLKISITDDLFVWMFNWNSKIDYTESITHINCLHFIFETIFIKYAMSLYELPERWLFPQTGVHFIRSTEFLGEKY